MPAEKTGELSTPGYLEKDSRWQLVERILATPAFARSARLSSLLKYVCEQFLAGNSASLNEQTIGEIVFERPVGYDPSDDNIVRSHASRLRLRLEAYFREEGSSEPIRVTIPKGGYAPVFERVAVEQPVEPSPPGDIPASNTSVENPPAAVASRKPFWTARKARWAVLPLGALLIGTLAWWSRGRFVSTTATSQTPTRKLWAQMFSKGRNTLIVPADSSLVIAKQIAGHAVSLSEYASGRYRNDNHCSKPCDAELLQDVKSLRYTSIADLEFAVALTRLPESIPDRTQIRYARDLQLEDLKQSNLIMAGSREADPWMEVIERQMNFRIHDDQSAGPLRVENVKPYQNEKSEYLFNDEDPQHHGLATIAFLPNLSGNGNLLVVQGFTLAGTEAAAEFITSGHDFDELLRAYASPNTQLPHFEILLETMDVNGMAAHPTVLAWRAYS